LEHPAIFFVQILAVPTLMKIQLILRPNTCNKLAYDFRINHFTQTKGNVTKQETRHAYIH